MTIEQTVPDSWKGKRKRAMSMDVECKVCTATFKRGQPADKHCKACKLAASDTDSENDSDNDLSSTARENTWNSTEYEIQFDSMKKVIDLVYEKVIKLEEEIVSLKKSSQRDVWKTARHYVTPHPKLCTKLHLRANRRQKCK